MRILITGGSGFIGTHLSNLLIKYGHDVYNIDKKINNNISPDKQKIIDLIDINVKDNFLDQKFDICIHLAALVSVQASIEDPIESFGNNVFTTLKVLDICKKNNIKKIIFSSSAAVYAEKNTPIVEEDAKNPVTPYALDKLTSEQYIQMYCGLWNIDYLIFRFFNVFGEGQNPEYAGVITAFNLAKQKNQPLIIYGDGEQSRDFIRVDHLCQYIIALINKNINNEIFNLGSGENITINNLAKQFGNDIIYKEARKEIRYSCANVEKFKKIL
jgi:UDP-glucose 4-epimerase